VPIIRFPARNRKHKVAVILKFKICLTTEKESTEHLVTKKAAASLRRLLSLPIIETELPITIDGLIPVEFSTSLVLGHSCLEEILLLSQVHRFAHPRERIVAVVLNKQSWA